MTSAQEERSSFGVPPASGCPPELLLAQPPAFGFTPQSREQCPAPWARPYCEAGGAGGPRPCPTASQHGALLRSPARAGTGACTEALPAPLVGLAADASCGPEAPLVFESPGASHLLVPGVNFFPFCSFRCLDQFLGPRPIWGN